MKLGLIGYPLKNTFSKNYFENKFRHLNWEQASYTNFPIETVELFKELLENEMGLNGLNVTIPYKEKIIPLLDEVDPIAIEIGAVNCIQFIKKEQHTILKGYNTDAFGFEQSLLNWLPQTSPNTALVFGNGGAAKAVIYVLKKLGFSVQLVGRTADPNKQKISYADLNKGHFEKHFLLVNCTPIGMSPNDQDLLPIPYEFISDQHYCYDLIYLPEKTAFLTVSEQQGAHIKNGLEMLHLQADKAFEIWQSGQPL